MKALKVWLLVLSLGLIASGCMKQVRHQGNHIDANSVWLIQEGDSRFRVETLLGTPMLIDPLHANKVRYVEEYNNPETGEKYTRSVSIVYDDALRVQSIQRQGFDN